MLKKKDESMAKYQHLLNRSREVTSIFLLARCRNEISDKIQDSKDSLIVSNFSALLSIAISNCKLRKTLIDLNSFIGGLGSR